MVTDTAGKVFGAFKKVVDVASELTAAYSIQEQAEVKLQSTLKATQNVCGLTATELLNMADSLSSVSTFSDQAILSVEQLLVSARTIGKDVIPEATKACLDMAAALGEDVVSSARRLAKVLADPKSNLDALKDANIQLTQSQKTQITSLQEQNRLYEAQQIVLEAVSSSYGGIAQALADTNTGKIDQLKNAWQDLKEGLGEMMMTSLDGLVDYTLSLVSKIEKMVEEGNAKQRARDVANAALDGSSAPDYTSMSDLALQTIIDTSAYKEWRDKYYNEVPNATPADLLAARERGIGIAFSQEDMDAYYAALDELQRRRVNAYNSRVESRRRSTNVSATAGLSSSSIAASLPNALIDASLNNIFSIAPTVENATLSSSSKPLSSVSSFLKSNGSLSVNYQINSLRDKIAEATSLLNSGGLTGSEVVQIEEIRDALLEQVDALKESQSATAEWVEEWNSASSTVSDIVDGLYDLGDSISSILSTFADNAISELEKIEEKWSEYFDEFDAKQERQRDSLNTLLASGNISYEEYINSLNSLDEERAAAEEKKTKDEEEARDKANSLNEAAFNAEKANSIAQAAINAALSITDIWASYGANPVVAGVLTGLSAAATATQIAAIASQSYTPLAVGGIVQSPTKALIGEGGHPEMILPLTDANMERFGMDGRSSEGGVIQLTINIGTAYNGEQLSEDVFRGIERAQRTGALPKWRYTA